MRVVWPPSALRDVRGIHDYLAEFNPKAAGRLAKALLAAGDSLVGFPCRGRPVNNAAQRELTIVRPYIIRYEIVGDEVWILRVRHDARRPSNP